VLAGTAFDLAGNAQASMGVDAADLDNDGLVDFHVTSYAGEFATLYRNLSGGLLEDATRVSGAGDGTLPHVTWGNACADFDNDGHRDLFLAAGHLDDNIHLRGGGGATAFAVPNLVLRNLGKGRFRDVSKQCAGDGLAPVKSSRGVAAGDLDGDGDPDVIVLNSRETPTVIRNDTGSANHWLSLRLAGVQCNRSGVGAAVKVFAGDAILVDAVRSGRGYQSDYGQWLHFGLGASKRVSKIEVRWSSGRTDTFTAVPVDRTIQLREAAQNFMVFP
jgi:hypothetical protein